MSDCGATTEESVELARLCERLPRMESGHPRVRAREIPGYDSGRVVQVDASAR